MKTNVLFLYFLVFLLEIHFFFFESVPEFLEDRWDDLKNFVKQHEKLFLGLLVIISFSSWVLFYTVFLIAVFFIALGVLYSCIFKRKEVEIKGKVLDIEPDQSLFRIAISDIQVSSLSASSASIPISWWTVRVQVEGSGKVVIVDTKDDKGIYCDGPFHAICAKYKLQSNNFALKKLLP